MYVTFNLEDSDDVAAQGPSLVVRVQVLRPQLGRIATEVLCLPEVHSQGGASGRTQAALDTLLEDEACEDYERLTTNATDGLYQERNLVVSSRSSLVNHPRTIIRHGDRPRPFYKIATASPPDAVRSDPASAGRPNSALTYGATQSECGSFEGAGARCNNAHEVRATHGGAGAMVPKLTKAGTASPLRLTLIGGFALVALHSAVEISVPHSGQRLIALLALSSQPLQRAYVAGTLWPDTTQQRAAGSLRSTLWRLNRPNEPVVRATPTHLRLSETLSVDVRYVEETVRRLMDPSATCSVEELNPTLLTGELLPDWQCDDWVLLERERLRQLCLHGLDAVGERFIALGRYGEAAAAASAAIRAEPLRESAHRLLISIHLAEGNQSEALRSYRWYERLLRDELRIAPSEQITQLVNSLPRAV